MSTIVNFSKTALACLLFAIIAMMFLLILRVWLYPQVLIPGTTVMTITNNEWSDGVVFCRGPLNGSMEKIFLDADLTHSVVKSDFDCAVEGSAVAKKWGVGVPSGSTLALGLKKGETVTLYIHPNGTWPSGACWFQDVKSNSQTSMAKGPRFMSEVEFTIQESEQGQIYYDMSSVEGVSGGITMNYTDDLGREQTAVAVPGKFQGDKLQVVTTPGFPTVLSDKNVLGSCDCPTWDPNDVQCTTEACFASCPGALVDNACGQHKCRVFYAQKYTDPRSYCGWLYEQKAQTYCWAMDEWFCVDETCGYGAADQPKADCSTELPKGAAANTYSCGHGASQLGVNGTILWVNGSGCVDKLVEGVPTNPAPARVGGRISISFEGLPWLHAMAV